MTESPNSVGLLQQEIMRYIKVCNISLALILLTLESEVFTRLDWFRLYARFGRPHPRVRAVVVGVSGVRYS